MVHMYMEFEVGFTTIIRVVTGHHILALLISVSTLFHKYGYVLLIVCKNIYWRLRTLFEIAFSIETPLLLAVKNTSRV